MAYISESNDPWFNLSYEDYLFRNTPVNQPVLFLYRHNPCVVIGRNQASPVVKHGERRAQWQNPWKESTPRYLRQRNIPLIRRRSGGGAVYHVSAISR